ncbi:MAG TPA: type II toxin-antitoxin system prevent-host-death family antitoxin [Vicinamibacterales bacterium]|nr:type II toxin-antitoxin system prevent-host-death family antitoxin [Vicinamibacterales bacterium]
MIRVNVFEVKARLSEYLDRASRGERIIVCRHNKPVAELRAIEPARTEPRPTGPLPGRPRFDVPPSFFEPLAEEDLAAWEGADVAYPLPESRSRPRAGKGSRVAESRQRAPRPRRRRSSS